MFTNEQQAIEKLQNHLTLRNYSKRTINAYIFCVSKFLSIHTDYNHFNESNIHNFLLELKNDAKAPQTINLYAQALLYFYKNIHNIKNVKLLIPKQKRGSFIPCVLSRSEIERILNVITNGKHKNIISLAYGAGLRVSEVVALRVIDLDFDRKCIHLKSAKGNKDRITLLPSALLNDLKLNIKYKASNDYLFESERGGSLSTRTVQKIFNNALCRAGINKPASFHSLRHSFATHLLENGVDIRFIQSLLGHNNIRTTQRYTSIANTHIQKIDSPL